MRSLETLIRVQRRQLDQLRRDLVALETLAADLRGQAAALEEEVKTQQATAKSGAPEVAFSYPNFARWAIERQGGLIELESELGRGSVFRIVMPVEKQTNF